MVQFTLPRGSNVVPGRTWNAPAGDGWRQFQIYRWHPEHDSSPRLDTYWVPTAECGPMVLDALFYIRDTIDPTLVFRRSCREGICGSCAMNMGGRNGLACLKPIADVSGAIRIFPLPHMRVIRDLVPDLGPFFQHYHSVEPWLHTDDTEPRTERLQKPAQRERLDGLYECILCACCSSACPSYWWNSERFKGPAALLQTYRWVADSRDTATEDRVDDVNEPMGIFGCRQILNCTQSCPKGLNPAKAIAELRKVAIFGPGSEDRHDNASRNLSEAGRTPDAPSASGRPVKP